MELEAEAVAAAVGAVEEEAVEERESEAGRSWCQRPRMDEGTPEVEAVVEVAVGLGVRVVGRNQCWPKDRTVGMAPQ